MCETVKQEVYATMVPVVTDPAQLIYDTLFKKELIYPESYSNLTDWRDIQQKAFEKVIFSDEVRESFEAVPADLRRKHLEAFRKRTSRTRYADGTPLGQKGETDIQILQREVFGGVSTMFENMSRFGMLLWEHNPKVSPVVKHTTAIARRISSVHVESLNMINDLFTTPEEKYGFLMRAVLHSKRSIKLLVLTDGSTFNVPRDFQPFDPAENFVSYLNKYLNTVAANSSLKENLEEEKRGCPFRRVNLQVEEFDVLNDGTNGVHAYINLVTPSFRRTLEYMKANG
jgi:hypothetical protein